MTDPSESSPDQRFLKMYRIKLRNDFRRVYDSGTVVSDSTLVIHGLRNGRDYSRIGLSIPKKVGSAPIRNQWKRWMREAFRLQRVDLPVGIDLIIRPKKDAQGSLEVVSKSLNRLMHKLHSKLPSD
jgi:ribonuclease P protein component